MSAPAPRRPVSGVYVGRPFGIPVYFDLTWVLLALYITVTYAPSFAADGESPGARSYALAFLVALLFAASVLAHELSHSVVARLLGLPVRRVTILFFGGVSEIDREPQTPSRSYLVSVAGPLMSLVLSAVLAAVVRFTDPGGATHDVLAVLVGVNGLVALVNLLPGLPLDGGHVLRALVWRITGSPVRGTVVAAEAGRVMAVLVLVGALVAIALATSDAVAPVMFTAALLAAYLWHGSTAELRRAHVLGRLPSLEWRRLVRQAIAVTADTPLAEAVRRARQAGAGAVVVVDHDGRPEALVDEDQVLATPPQRQPWVSVGSLGRALVGGLILDTGLTGGQLIEAVRTTPATDYLVVEPDGRVLGVLVTADLARALQTG